MNTRLQQFLGAENISQSQFADELGVARASVSHILAGRNKPGYDFLASLMARYPRLNIEWLMVGKGKMYKDSPSSQEDQPQVNLFTSPQEDEISPSGAPEAADSPLTEAQTPPAKEPQPSENKRTVSKIIVFFDDNTFQEIM